MRIEKRIFKWDFILIIEKPAVVIQKFHTKKKKKRKVNFCEITDKVQYTEDLAKLKAKNYKKKKLYIRAYCCEYCNKWHLTSKRQDTRKFK